MSDYKVGQWYPWTGGEQPVPSNTEVQVFLANGTKNDGAADEFIWHYVGNDCDIVAFRVIDYPDENVTIPKPDRFENFYSLHWANYPETGNTTETEVTIELKYKCHSDAQKAIKALKGNEND